MHKSDVEKRRRECDNIISQIEQLNVIESFEEIEDKSNELENLCEEIKQQDMAINQVTVITDLVQIEELKVEDTVNSRDRSIIHKSQGLVNLSCNNQPQDMDFF